MGWDGMGWDGMGWDGMWGKEGICFTRQTDKAERATAGHKSTHREREREREPSPTQPNCTHTHTHLDACAGDGVRVVAAPVLGEVREHAGIELASSTTAPFHQEVRVLIHNALVHLVRPQLPPVGHFTLAFGFGFGFRVRV
jgi:hypothetical protein